MAWSSRTISSGPTHRHCPPPGCCFGWQNHCSCSSCTYRRNLHPHHRVFSPRETRLLSWQSNIEKMSMRKQLLIHTMIRIPCLRGPVVWSVSLSLSFSYSHSTPFSMTDFSWGYWFSPLMKNSPEATFFTAEKTKQRRAIIPVFTEMHAHRKVFRQYQKCARWISALGSASVAPLWEFQELWGNLKCIYRQFMTSISLNLNWNKKPELIKQSETLYLKQFLWSRLMVNIQYICRTFQVISMGS